LVQRLKQYTRVQSVSITGHTDRLGSDAYNDRLSRVRAATIKAYFEEHGIRPESLTALGRGKREPVTQGCGSGLSRQTLVRCLQPDRRVAIEVTGSAP
ncbi:MAG: OmpA family protein, partial [Ramlibacter sp.]